MTTAPSFEPQQTPASSTNPGRSTSIMTSNDDSDKVNHAHEIKHSDQNNESDEINQSDEMAIDKTNSSSDTSRSNEINHSTEANHSDETNRSEEVALNPGTKRDADSLFVSQDENLASANESSVKRPKLDHKDQSCSSQSGPAIVNGKVAPYDAFAVEGRPPLSIYHPSFGVSEKMVTQVCTKFIAEYKDIKSNGYDNAEMDNIVKRGVNRFRFPAESYPDVQPVSFLGPAGTGKSSGMICYLSQLGAAVESDMGNRGTNVVHEYSSARPGQTEKFIVVVRYKSAKQIEKTIIKHCRGIFAYTKLERSDKDELDEEEFKDLKEKHDTALDFFSTVLHDREGFESEADCSEYFDERRDDDEEDIVKDLKEIIDSLLEKRGVKQNDNMEAYAAETESELSNVFQTISGPSGIASMSTRKSSLWPLVIKIQIHQDKDMLNAGVVLADTPGVTDTNQTVVQNTKSYLKTAGTIIVFATPSRIEKNPDLDGNLRACISLGKMHNTHLVITMIDQKSEFKEVDRCSLSDDDKERLHAAETYVQQLKDEIVRTKQAQESIKDIEEFKTYASRVTELEKDERRALMMVKQVTIQIRNDLIKKTLKDKLRLLSGSRRAPDLNMIFTSNQEYQKHLAGYDEKEPPILDISATGIPAVREMLYEVPARGKFNKLTRIVKNRLPNIFNGIIGILTKSPLERKHEVEELITKVLDAETELVNQMMRELRSKFKIFIMDYIKENEPKWRQAALLKLREWQDYNAGTFGAFCRRSGYWKPRKGAEKLNWNTEIQNIYAPKLTHAFNILEDENDILEMECITEITNLYQKLQDELEACEAFQGSDEKPFFQFIHGVREHLLLGVSNVFEGFKQQVDSIRTAVLMNTDDPESDTSYPAMAMQETYLECLKKSSTSVAPALTYINKRGKTAKKSGTHAARVEEIRKKLAGDGGEISVFTDIAQLANTAYSYVLKDWDGKWRKKFTSASNTIKRDFEMRFDTPDVKSEEQDEEQAEASKRQVEALKSAALEAMGVITGEMAEELAKCEAWQKSGY